MVVFFRNADSGVRDVDAGIKLPGTHRDGDASALRRVFDRVVQNVSQSLCGPPGIVLYADIVCAVRRQADSLLFGLRPHRAHGAGDGVVQPPLRHMENEGPGFQTGHFDEGLQEKIQLVDLLRHGGKKGVALFVREVVLLQDFRKHPDVCDGRFDLMGNVADQSLDGFLVPAALKPAFIGEFIILHQLSLHPGGQGIIVGMGEPGPLVGQEGVQGFAQLIGEPVGLAALSVNPQPGEGAEAGTGRKDSPAYRSSGDKSPQKPQKNGREADRGQKKKGGNEGGVMKEAADKATALLETGRQALLRLFVRFVHFRPPVQI